MPTLARILVLVREPHEARRLIEQVRQRGYYGFSATTLAEGARLARQLLTDLVIVDAFLSDGDGCDLVDMLKRTPDTAHIPVIMLADKFDGTLRRRSLSVGVDDLIIRPIEDDILFARLAPLVRLGTMHGELQRRTITARTFRTDVDLRNIRRSRDSAASILLVPSTVDAEREIEPLLRSTYNVTSVQNPYAANELLLKKRFDAVILATDKDSRDDHFSLCTHIRDNPRLFNLPVVMVSEQDAVTDTVLAHRAGASELIWRPVHPDDFRVRLVTLVRRQRLRENIRLAFEATRSAETTDPATGLYNNQFIRVHLTRAGLRGGEVGQAPVNRGFHGQEHLQPRQPAWRGGRRRSDPSGSAPDSAAGPD